MMPAKLVKAPVQLMNLDFDKALGLSKEELRKHIDELEQVLSEYPQAEFPLEHYFANSHTEKGVYARELFIPKGSLLIGNIHRYETINIIQGDCSVISIDGVFRVEKRHTYVSSKGAKRIIYAHEDTYWTTTHATQSNDPGEAVKEFTTKSYAELGE